MWQSVLPQEERFGNLSFEEQTMWNLDPPPGFQGLDPHKPLTVYYRHLPHWRQDGATYFVTYRQADSLPQSKLRQLEILKAEWESQHPPPQAIEAWEELSRLTMQRVEEWLDQGMGSCRLRDERAKKLVVEAMHHFDDQRYELGGYVILPNHVHVILRPLEPQTQPLETILQSWKRYTSRRINALFGVKGHLWQEESFDRIIRDEEHLWRVIQYVGQNPAKAGLAIAETCLWLRLEWERLGWIFAAPNPT
jgi:REP element-mobilizing transposase RayT